MSHDVTTGKYEQVVQYEATSRAHALGFKNILLSIYHQQSLYIAPFAKKTFVV